MISPMTKYSFILLAEEQEKFLEQIRNLGLVDITRSDKPVDAQSARMLEEASGVRKALGITNRADYRHDPDFEAISARIPDVVTGQTVGDKVLAALKANESIELLNTELQAAKKEKASRLVWGDFDGKRLEQLSEAGYTMRFYSVPLKLFSESWGDLYPLQIISEDKTHVHFVTVARSDGQYRFPVTESPAPQGSWKETEARIRDIKARIIDNKAVLMKLGNSVNEMEEEERRILSDMDVYLAGVSGERSSENMITTFVGFSPAEDETRLCAVFDKMDVYYFKEPAELDDNPPIELRNNRFVSMFQVLTDMYGRPAYNEFDPTPYLSVFFMLFFAFCMGDAGYGIVLIVIGLLLKKVKSFASMSPLVVTLGAATTVVGFLFHTFFSIDIAEWGIIPQWMKSVMLPGKIAGYDGTMVLAIIVGIIHLSLAMIVKAVVATRNNGFLNSLGTWGWTLFLVGSVVVGAFSLMGVLDSNVTKWTIIVLGGISAIGIYLLNDLKRNPLINIGAGLWETYNTATGVLGDVLSYLRLYALGLAGGMLGYAFNELASGMISGGGNIIGWLGFILIVLIGHTLNIAMAALGAFVHPLRLNFLEFFKNSGYEGTGRNYSPLTIEKSEK